jgi:hypothetical protein
VEITNGCTLVIVATNDAARLQFAIANSGDIPAERVKLSVGVPRNFQIGTAQLANWRSWTQADFVKANGQKTLKVDTLSKGYFLELDTILSPYDCLNFTPMEIIQSGQSPTTKYPVALKIDARQAMPKVLHFELKIENASHQILPDP